MVLYCHTGSPYKAANNGRRKAIRRLLYTSGLKHLERMNMQKQLEGKTAAPLGVSIT
jgi:hypothetical protein